MALAIDASTPALVTQNAAFITSLASNSFSPPAGSLLVVVVGFPSSANAVTSITDSLGTPLTYTNRVAHAAGATDTEIWVADCPSAQTGMTVTANFSNSKGQCIGVLVMTGAKAAASQTGVTATADPTSPPSIAVAGTTTGSFVIAGFGDFASGNTPTTAGGQTFTFNSHSYFFSDGGGAGDGCWFQSTSSPSSGGTVTLSCTAPTDTTHIAAAEILAAGGGTSVSITVPAAHMFALAPSPATLFTTASFIPPTGHVFARAGVPQVSVSGPGGGDTRALTGVGQ